MMNEFIFKKSDRSIKPREFNKEQLENHIISTCLNVFQEVGNIIIKLDADEIKSTHTESEIQLFRESQVTFLIYCYHMALPVLAVAMQKMTPGQLADFEQVEKLFHQRFLQQQAKLELENRSPCWCRPCQSEWDA
jgi:hypothetical protein